MDVRRSPVQMRSDHRRSLLPRSASRAVALSQSEAVSKAGTTLGKIKSVLPFAIATTNGALFFFIAMTGAGEIESLFHSNTDTPAIYFVSALTSLSNVFFVYKVFSGLTLVPKSGLSCSLSSLAPFASCAYLTAGIAGAQRMGLSNTTSYAIGGTLFVLRNIVMVDSAVKFPTKFKALIYDIRDSYTRKDVVAILRLAFVTVSAVAVSASTSDSVYSAIHWLGSFATENETTLTPICYASSFLGSLGIFPAYMYWINRGVIQLTNTGRRDEEENNIDPTDRYTYLSLIGIIPTTLGILGSAAHSTGNVFGRLGEFASVIRVSSSFIATVGTSVPGMSTALRNLVGMFPSSSQVYFWHSTSSRSSTTSETDQQ